MMLSTNTPIRLTSWTRRCALAALVAAVSLDAAPSMQLQTDVRSQFMLGNSNRSFTPPSTDPAPGFAGNLIAALELAPVFSVFAEGDADYLFGIPKKSMKDSVVDATSGATSRIPASERRYAGSYQGAAGLRLDWVGSLVAGYQNTGYYLPARMEGSRLLRNFYGYFDSTYLNWFHYHRDVRHSIYGSYQFDDEFLTTDLSTNLFLNQGTINTITSKSDGTDSLVRKVPDLDRWFYNSALVGGKIPVIGTLVAADARIVTHVDRARNYDIYNVGLSLSDNANVFDNRCAYKARSSLYLQEYITDTTLSNYATTGFYQTFYLRDSYTLTDWLMLKGLAVMTLADEVFKQRYEFAVRTAFRATESWVDVGGFSTMGGLFPMTGIYARTMIRPIDRIGIGLTGKSEWNWPGDTDNAIRVTQFLKAVCNAELSFRIVQPLEVYVSGDYTYFDWRATTEFPPRYTFALGTRALIP